MWLLLVAAIVVMLIVFADGQTRRSKINWGFFRLQLEEGNITEIQVEGVDIYGKFRDPPLNPDAKRKREEGKLREDFVTTVPPYVLEDPNFDDKLFAQLQEKYSVSKPPDTTGFLVWASLLVTIVLFAGVWIMIRRTQSLSTGMLSGFGKSPARRYQSGDKPVTFEEVAGLESVKSELEEVVEYLKNPTKFQRLGGRVPKGVLLIGPPGTGKTLLGRAVAGEAKVPFFSINGSEFIQMFVGVGASRVRDLFTTAKDSAPAILFIDEIDAVGRHRGTGLGGGHDEREQTLNQILSEMDGFTQSESVIVMAATNRPDVLDPALLRPGRFDRHVTVDRPTLRGRTAIFKVHSREVPLADDVDLERLAASTVGLTGADIRNLVNEAALWATRQGKDAVEMADFEYARDKILMGAKREDLLSGEEKRMTAYHEAGHVLLSWLVRGADPVHKVSIIPRGRALGATQVLPEEDRFNVSEKDLQTRLAFILGGRAAEKIRFDQYTAGCEDDLKKATALARRMVTHWGMSERLGPVAFRHGEHHPFLGKEMGEPREYSEHTARLIDEEVTRILGEASERAMQLLTAEREKLEKLAEALDEREELDEHEIEAIIGPPAYDRKKRGETPAATPDGASTAAAKSASSRAEKRSRLR
ncbi:MAG: ATP-dependent zinc metalloprotease FtsH [Pirellulaceae bacterium]|jgi:cell division protease FtsH|nr:ATP-dependent zinc metalloprotease FtsH [Thermoguttaceae bacterium]NLZ02953.1 ATP-dependent zinc metalloprotease FtsH [Pirellulaceae bacterium]